MTKLRALTFSLLFLITSSVFAQIQIENTDSYPPAVVIECMGCDPTDDEDHQVRELVYEGASTNYKNCFGFGENEFGKEASEEECGRGQVLVRNEWGDIALYYYVGLTAGPTSGYMLMFFTPAPRIDGQTDCSYLKACQSTKQATIGDRIFHVP